ncbi:prophage regulatory protein [Pseudomonas sp. JUb42]|uniref:helix-turn-helix transcriptional regulator n=1 Tax=Pseudomonas sp. JUb42 TaxID=2940611 RepID=UPI002167B3CB|nr:AlpA family transcriptional regulator [Pseudomonas sp. JUb42]MCS3471227.1 prophage regulatory protein [Pseudomonas sp. JUb42]
MNTALKEEPVELIRRPEVMKLTGIRTTKLYELIKEGQFPKQVHLGGRTVGWVKSEVIAWNRAQVAAARADQATPTKSR